jgi:hypothetical protein
MSGPVWRRFEKSEDECEICLETADTSYVEGIVEAGEFKPRKQYCENCYRMSHGPEK